MILIDTNVIVIDRFVIDRFFHRDARYEQNRRLIEIFPKLSVGFSIFSLLELCGISSLFEGIEKRMTLGDVFVLQTAEESQVETLVTWNPKDFANRTSLPVLTPVEFLAQQEEIP